MIVVLEWLSLRWGGRVFAGDESGR